jgi:hypothetical protein
VIGIEALIASLNARGIRLIPDGNGLIAKPASRLTDHDRQAIRANKLALLAYLRCREVALWCKEDRIDATIGAAILEIEPLALALGWTYERLWNPHFWPHSAEHPRGLASVMSPGDELAEVTRDFIVIHETDGQCQRFPRLDS